MEVPKFGSFKPKLKAVPADEEPSLAKEKDRPSERNSSHRAEKRHRSKDRHRERDHRLSQNDDHHDKRRHHGVQDDRNRRHISKHERYRSRDVQPELKQETRKTQGHSAAITQDEFLESDLFIVDRRGDSKNIEYGSLHRYSVPAYRRTGFGNLIGRPLSSKIDREASNEKEISLMSSALGKRTHQKAARLLSSKYGKSSETRLRFVSAVEPDVKEDGGENEFIALSPFRKRKRGSESPQHDASVDYRSIEGRAKASNKPADADVEVASDSDEAAYHTSDLRARQQNAILSKKAKATPLALDLWLALTEHQSQLIRPGDEASSFTTSERRTLAELRLSILNEAAKHISADKPDRERLLLATIEEGVPLWDKTKLAAKWKETLKECPSSILLWTRYMDFVQYDHSSFQYENCKDAYMRWLQILKTAYESSNGEERTRVCHTQIYALLRFTTFARYAGYDEVATAVWQALLEFHLFSPKQLADDSLEARLQSLEDYWDAETPRLGEEGTLTWAGYVENGSSNAPRRAPAQSPPVNVDPRTPLTSFAQGEAALANMFLLPAATEDDDAITDPFRCIMFDDLRTVVECLSIELPKDGLISAFFHFAGLPPLPRRYADAKNWSLDPHLAIGSDATKMLSRQETTFGLFQDAFQPFNDRHGEGDDGFAKFIDRVLECLLQHEKDEDDTLREYYLAFKASTFPKEAPKAAKKLSKTRSTSLRLYNAFALIEAGAGRMDKAMSAWAAALGMLPRLDPNAQHDALLLWHSRFLTQVDSGDEECALKALLNLSDSEKPTTGDAEEKFHHIQHLRLRRHLESSFDQTLLSSKFQYAVLCADLLAWLAYLTSEVASVIALYNARLATLTRSGTPAAVEELQQCKIRLLGLHIDRRRPYKPAAFQHEVTEALRQFPSNSLLLNLNGKIASQDRLRTLVAAQKEPVNTSLIQWAFQITTEIERVEDSAAGGATPHSVRSTFTSALLGVGSGAKHSVGIWKAWLAFELRNGDKRRARNVFLDGLRALPGVKEWAVEGMRAGLMEEGEMRRVWEGTLARGLRVRVGIEEFV
jgi:hypothetical protein